MHLPRLLEGISQQTLTGVEVILVDSGSTDDTVKIALSFGAKIVHIKPEDFTFGRSLNMGIGAAVHEYLVFASAHVYPVYPDWLERLLEPLADSQIAVSYGKQRGPDTARFSEQQVYYQWYPEKSDFCQLSPFCNNANAAIRRSLWEKNPYDEGLTGLEDLAWAKRVIEQGYSVAYVAEAEIIHVHNETPTGVLNRYRREAMTFKRLYPEANFSLYDLVRLAFSNILSDLWNACLQGRLLGNVLSIFWFRGMQFYGTWLGYRHPGLVNAQLRETFYYPRGRQPGKFTRRSVEPIRYNH